MEEVILFYFQHLHSNKYCLSLRDLQIRLIKGELPPFNSVHSHLFLLLSFLNPSHLHYSFVCLVASSTVFLSFSMPAFLAPSAATPQPPSLLGHTLPDPNILFLVFLAFYLRHETSRIYWMHEK